MNQSMDGQSSFQVDELFWKATDEIAAEASQAVEAVQQVAHCTGSICFWR